MFNGTYISTFLQYILVYNLHICKWWLSSKGFILIELVNLNDSKTFLQYIQSKYKMGLSVTYLMVYSNLF